MNVIVFASRKGGSGKSTLAAHLAAHVHKSTKPCLLVDADPQGSLTLWHKLRGTNEPPIKSAVNSVSGIVAAAKRDGIEWVFIDTPPNTVGRRRRRHQERHDGDHSGAAGRVRRQRRAGNDSDLPRGAQALCGRDQRRAGRARRRRKPHRHHRARSAGQIPRAGVGRPDHQPRRSVDGARARAKAPANITRKAAPRPRSASCGLRSNVRSRRSAARRRPPAPCTSRRRNQRRSASCRDLQERAGSARFSLCCGARAQSELESRAAFTFTIST